VEDAALFEWSLALAFAGARMESPFGEVQVVAGALQDLKIMDPTLPVQTKSTRKYPRDVRLVQPAYGFAKRGTDLAVCLLLLPVVAVVLSGCAVLIWLEDRGPVFFVQWRTGKAGRRFPMLKLRTMVRKAEQHKEQHRDHSRLSWPDFKLEKDPRVTRVGWCLRRSSLDELPQIFNVLRGEMSLVGPRPTSFAASTYSLPQTERLEVRPGVTGLWQVQGRSDIDFDDRVLLDVQYIERRGYWYDLEIMLRTIPSILSGRGAA